MKRRGLLGWLAMDPTAGFIAYAIVYRLAIIIAGVVAVVLGYRLFVCGFTVHAGDGGATDASAEAAGFKLSIRNAAPGTCFAAFGAALISAMVVQGNPELTMGSTSPEAGLHLKGLGRTVVPGSFEAEFDRARTLAKSGDRSAALAAYGRALSASDVGAREVAAASGAIAEVYLQQGRAKEALALARLAVQLDPHRVDTFKVLADAALANGETAEAAAAARRVDSPAVGDASTR